MPLSSATVGTLGEPLVHEIDARWTMAYAAGLGDTLPCYLDTRRPEGVVAHPLFPVCCKWPVILGLRGHPGNRSLTADERLRSVHATHDLTLHRSREVTPEGDVVRFEVRNAEGEPAVRDGLVALRAEQEEGHR